MSRSHERACFEFSTVESWHLLRCDAIINRAACKKRVVGCRGLRGRGVLGFLVSWFLGSFFSKFLGFKDYWFLGFNVSWFQNFKVSKI